MVLDEDHASVGEKAQDKTKYVPKLLVSYEISNISNEEKIGTIVA